MMGGLRVDAKELPLPLREQVAVKIAEKISSGTPVAVKPAQSVRFRRMVFYSDFYRWKWKLLRRLEAMGFIGSLEAVKYEGTVVAVTYQILKKDPEKLPREMDRDTAIALAIYPVSGVVWESMGDVIQY